MSNMDPEPKIYEYTEENAKKVELVQNQWAIRRGLIISWAIELEDMLDVVIGIVFFEESYNKNHLQVLEMLEELTFAKKIDLFEKMSKAILKEDSEQELLKKTISSLKEVKNTRNQFAHRRISYFINGTAALEKDKTELSDEKFEKIKSEINQAFDYLRNLQVVLFIRKNGKKVG